MLQFRHTFVIAVQSCRGSNLDKDDSEMPTDDASSPEEDWDEPVNDQDPIRLEADRRAIQEDTEAFASARRRYDSLLEGKEDFLVLLATREGCVSWRNPVRGSYMLQALCLEIRNSTIFDNLPDVMQRTKVRTYKMVKRRDPNWIQIPQIINTLRAKLCIKRFEPRNERYSVKVYYGRGPWPPETPNVAIVGVTAQEYVAMKENFTDARRILARKGVTLESLPEEVP